MSLFSILAIGGTHSKSYFSYYGKNWNGKKAIFEFEKYAGISNGKNFAIWIASSNIYLLVLTRNIQLKVHISGWNWNGKINFNSNCFFGHLKSCHNRRNHFRVVRAILSGLRPWSINHVSLDSQGKYLSLCGLKKSQQFNK